MKVCTKQSIMVKHGFVKKINSTKAIQAMKAHVSVLDHKLNYPLRTTNV